MTGATNFTRKAGLCGLLSLPLVALGFIGVATRDRETALTFVAASMLALLVHYVGILVRHREERWARPVTLAFFLSLAIGFTVSGTLGVLGAGVTLMAMYLGILLAGILPRAAVVLMLLSVPLGAAEDSVPVAEVAAFLLSGTGSLWLAWAMWREKPVSQTRRPGESVPASPGLV